MKIHVACSVLNWPVSFTEGIRKLKGMLVEAGHELVEDTDWKENCEMYLVILDHQSTLVGMEIVDMINKGVTVLAFAQVGSIQHPDITNRQGLLFWPYVTFPDDIPIALDQHLMYRSDHKKED